MDQFSDQEVTGSIPGSVMLTNPERIKSWTQLGPLGHQMIPVPLLSDPSGDGPNAEKELKRNVKADVVALSVLATLCTVGHFHDG